MITLHFCRCSSEHRDIKHLAKFLWSFCEPSVLLSITEPCDSRIKKSQFSKAESSYLPHQTFLFTSATWLPLLLPSFSLKWGNFADSKLMAAQARMIQRAGSHRETDRWDGIIRVKLQAWNPIFATAFLPIPDILSITASLQNWESYWPSNLSPAGFKSYVQENFHVFWQRLMLVNSVCTERNTRRLNMKCLSSHSFISQ